MQAAMHRPLVPPERKHVPLPSLKPTTHVVTAVAAAMSGDLELRFGASGDTPCVSDASESESEGEHEESEGEGEGEGESEGEEEGLESEEDVS